MDDAGLLTEFVESANEDAFNTITVRYSDMVYSTCLRGLLNRDMAEDACQAVFITLAKKAKSIRNRNSLPVWLFRTARSVVSHMIRNEQKRRRHEEEVKNMAHINGLSPDKTIDPDAIKPYLNDAIGVLGKREQHAVISHFFKEKTYKEIGQQAGCSEDAVRMRMSRALEKMRKVLKKKGVSVPSAALTGFLTQRAVEAAPGGLAASCHAASMAALAGNAAAFSKAVLLSEGVIKMMFWVRIKMATALLCATAIVGTGTGITVKTLAEKDVRKKSSPPREAKQEQTTGGQADKGLQLVLAADRTEVVIKSNGTAKPVTLTLSLVNVGTKPLAFYPDYMEDSAPGWLPFHIEVVSPKKKSATSRIDFYSNDAFYGANSHHPPRKPFASFPAKMDPLSIAAGKKFVFSCTISMVKLWRETMGEAGARDGTYRLRMSFKRPRQPGTKYWAGIVTSNELVLNVLPAGGETAGPGETANPGTSPAAQTEPELYPFAEGAKWGLIDKTGGVVVKPRFHQIGLEEWMRDTRLFSEGLAPVKLFGDSGKPDKWGYINPRGEPAIELRFTGVEYFRNGLARVRVGGCLSRVRGLMQCTGGKWGLIDRTGVFVLAAKFDAVGGGFSEGLIPVCRIAPGGHPERGWGWSVSKGYTKWGYADRSGKLVIEPKYDWVRPFSDGLAVFGVRCGDKRNMVTVPMKFGAIDRSGATVLNPQFAMLGDFHEGMAAAIPEKKRKSLDSDPEKRRAKQMLRRCPPGPIDTAAGYKAVGYVDRTGTFVIPPKFMEGARFREGTACVRVAWDELPESLKSLGIRPHPYTRNAGPEYWATIDRTGRIVAEPRLKTGPGLSRVLQVDKQNRSRWAGIDTNGTIVPIEGFRYVGAFSEGLAVVRRKQGGLCGYVDAAGKLAIQPQFTDANAFNGGVAWVNVGRRMQGYHMIDPGKWGLIDKTGTFVLQPSFLGIVTDFGPGRSLAAVKVSYERQDAGDVVKRITKMAYVNRKGEVVFNYEIVRREPKGEQRKGGGHPI